MDETIRTVLTVLGSITVGLGGAWFLFKGKRVEQETEETKTESAATSAFLAGQFEFQEFVENVVQQRVNLAVAGLQEQVTELAAKLRIVQRESHEMNDAIRSRETRLWIWNLEKRVGPMPELPPLILERLGIGHLGLQPTPDDAGPTGSA